MSDLDTVKSSKLSKSRARAELYKNNPFDNLNDDGSIIKNNSKSNYLYSELYSDLEMYLVKLPNSFMKRSVQYCIDNNLIFYGQGNLKHFGGIIFNGDSIGGYFIDYQNLGVNFRNGEIESVDELLYALYFLIVRSIIISSYRELTSNDKLNNEVITYLRFAFLKALGISRSGEKQKEFFKGLVTLFYYWKMALEDYNLSKEKAKDIIPEELKEEFEFLLDNNNIKNYSYFKDILKAFVDFKIVQETPNKLIIQFVKEFKTKGYTYLFSSLDYLIALTILSKYPFDYLSQCLVDKKIQDNIEKMVAGYFNESKFDLDYLSFYRKD